MDPAALAQVEVLALTIWGEARGQSHEGRVAVGNVAMNRVRWPRWWGRTVHGVCLAPRQFSCWNPGDVNRAKIEALVAAGFQGNTAYPDCFAIAQALLAGTQEDLTQRADHYHTRAVSPSWAAGQTPVAEIDDHRFYRLELPDPTTRA